MHPALQVAGIKIFSVNPWANLHVRLCRSRERGDEFGPLGGHMAQKATDEIRDQFGSECPTGAEIPEHPNHVGNSCEHHTAIGDGVVEIERGAINLKVDISERIHIEPRGGHNDVRFNL